MRAAQLVQPRTWKLIEVDKPEVSNGNMLVRLERVAICGTDRPSFWGGYPSYPLEPGDTGHEGMGIVEACPSGRYAEGERVLLSHFDRGLFQEYVLARDEGVVRLPAEGRLEVILMSQLLGTVIHCFYKLGNLINKDIVVIGQGPVGQLFNACLRNLGARRIVAVDPNRHRLAVARKMGATHVIDPAAEDVRAAVTELTGAEMADCAVEAVGAAETLNLAAGLLKRGGTLVSFGVPDKDNHVGIIPLEFRSWFVNETRLIASVGPNPQMDYTVALQWITEGRLDVSPILTHVLPFEQIQQGFETAFLRPEEEEAVKVVLKF